MGSPLFEVLCFDPSAGLYVDHGSPLFQVNCLDPLASLYVDLGSWLSLSLSLSLSRYSSSWFNSYPWSGNISGSGVSRICSWLQHKVLIQWEKWILLFFFSFYFWCTHAYWFTLFWLYIFLWLTNTLLWFAWVWQESLWLTNTSLWFAWDLARELPSVHSWVAVGLN